MAQRHLAGGLSGGVGSFWGTLGLLGDYAITSAAATDLAKLCDELRERVRLQQEALDAALGEIDGLREQIDDYEGQLQALEEEPAVAWHRAVRDCRR